ncbi:MAG TPA: DUF559 domain-containing protein [Candidatus Ornithocaccomicrobium faecavium]|uniref:DUF559 domain-containing protein n=1 Tax=Candidatus Ornithocaccomicrobium faecavium TaxID=2840890 RepID=A0A9D1P5Y9_9FIRM|nr:DUF559 domain-containing protein [Candidatus Ornithocaccomicrobium faecavium]
MSSPYQRKEIPYAKALRKNAMPQEKHLWYNFLRHYPVHFQRQKMIERFIADFYCHAARLVVEIEGSQHYYTEQGLTCDAECSAILSHYHLKVLRFSNCEIDSHFKNVCRQIHTEVQTRLEGELL